jgi:methanogenic corrinoid protein MtbC1
VQALAAGDEAAASQVAGYALRQSATRVGVFADLVQPAMRLLSDLWYAGSIRSDDEGRACEIATRVAEALTPTPAPEPVLKGSTCLLATLAGERHSLGLRLLARALEDDGWRVEVMLGVTPQGLLESVGDLHPRWVGVSASYLRSPKAAASLIAALRKLNVPVVVGGQAFRRVPELWRQVGASSYGLDARVGVVMARKFAASLPRVPAASLEGGSSPAAAGETAPSPVRMPW